MTLILFVTSNVKNGMQYITDNFSSNPKMHTIIGLCFGLANMYWTSITFNTANKIWSNDAYTIPKDLVLIVFYYVF